MVKGSGSARRPLEERLAQRPALLARLHALADHLDQSVADGTITGQGLSGFTYFAEGNTNLNTSFWVPLGDVTADGSGRFNSTDTNTAAFPQRFYRFRLQ